MKKLRISKLLSAANTKLHVRNNTKLHIINEQLRATTDQLNESEEKYKLLIDNMSDMVWITDSDGVVTFINNEAKKILGYEKEEMLQKPLYNVICPLHQYENCSDIIEEMKNSDFYRQELWMLHADGSTRKVIETNTKRLYSNNVLIGMQGVGRDVTERIRMERKLKKKNNQLSMLNDISSAIASSKISLNTTVLFDNICKKIVDTIHIPFCSIRLLNEDSKLHCVSAAGSLKDRLNLAPVEINIADFRSILLLNDIYQFSKICREYLFDHNTNLNIKDMLQNMLFVPIIMNKQPIGIITICCTDELDEDYIDMLGSITNNITFAIEKSNLYGELKEYYLKTIKTLIAAIEAKDTYTQGHSVRVAQYSTNIAKELDMSQAEIEEIEIAGILHDIGKIGISDTILTKPGLLESNEYEIIMNHPEIGCRILKPIGLSDDIINATLLHHKRYDLTGYPKEEIVTELPLYANIICIADAYDAMTSNRSYKLPMTKYEALEELKRNSGTQFCPKLVEIMIVLHNKNII